MRSTDPENFILEPNITSIGKALAKLWPFLNIQYGRQPPSWIYRTANSAIRSTDPENPRLEPNLEWIGCTICEIIAFKVYCDLETGVRCHSRSSKTAPFDRTHTTLYLSSIVTMPLSLTVSEIQPHICRKSLPPLYNWRPGWGWRPQIYITTLGDEKLEWRAYRTVKEFRWYVQPFWYNTRVWRTDWQTDGQTELAWHIRAIACCRA